MKLTVNGKTTELASNETLTITALLAALNVQQPDYVTVELNGEILERDCFDTITTKDGDRVEFLYFMGGGAY
jgi:sulfur carrier protein